jgi:hypothetical protein
MTRKELSAAYVPEVARFNSVCSPVAAATQLSQGDPAAIPSLNEPHVPMAWMRSSTADRRFSNEVSSA